MIPTRKVSTGAGASAIAIISVWALNKWAHAEISTEMAGTFQLLFAFILSYVVPDAGEADAEPPSDKP